MSEMTDDDKLRGLIRFLAPARMLKLDQEKILHMELWEGIGDAAVKAFCGLRNSVAAYTDDSYIDSLTIDESQNLNDEQKVTLVVFLAGQLLAFIEGQTGVASLGGDYAFNVNIQKAPILQNSTNNAINWSADKSADDVEDDEDMEEEEE